MGAYTGGTTIAATMTATVDFSPQGMSFTTTNSRTLNEGSWVNQDTRFDLTGTNFKYQPQTNQITGSVTDTGNRIGSISACFYGPNADQIRGAFSTGAGGDAYTGTFGGKRGTITPQAPASAPAS